MVDLRGVPRQHVVEMPRRRQRSRATYLSSLRSALAAVVSGWKADRLHHESQCEMEDLPHFGTRWHLEGVVVTTQRRRGRPCFLTGRRATCVWSRGERRRYRVGGFEDTAGIYSARVEGTLQPSLVTRRSLSGCS